MAWQYNKIITGGMLNECTTPTIKVNTGLVISRRIKHAYLPLKEQQITCKLIAPLRKWRQILSESNIFVIDTVIERCMIVTL